MNTPCEIGSSKAITLCEGDVMALAAIIAIVAAPIDIAKKASRSWT